MFFNSYYYYGTIALQAVCVIHCLRSRKDTMWIWLIVFLPVVGCLAYIVMEMFNTNPLRQVQPGAGAAFFPAGKIKKLKKQLEFSDTFNNRILLADAYLLAGNTEEAIHIYETSLTGAFAENEHVQMQLIEAYWATQQYDKLIGVAKKMYHTPQFVRSHAHVLYAMALEKAGRADEAEKEFATMKTKYSYFEARYQYGMLLLNQHRPDEAQKIWADMAGEFSYLSSFEKRANRPWYSRAKGEMKRLNAPSRA